MILLPRVPLMRLSSVSKGVFSSRRSHFNSRVDLVPAVPCVGLNDLTLKRKTSRNRIVGEILRMKV